MPNDSEENAIYCSIGRQAMAYPGSTLNVYAMGPLLITLNLIPAWMNNMFSNVWNLIT